MQASVTRRSPGMTRRAILFTRTLSARYGCFVTIDRHIGRERRFYPQHRDVRLHDAAVLILREADTAVAHCGRDAVDRAEAARRPQLLAAAPSAERTRIPSARRRRAAAARCGGVELAFTLDGQVCADSTVTAANPEEPVIKNDTYQLFSITTPVACTAPRLGSAPFQCKMTNLFQCLFI